MSKNTGGTHFYRIGNKEIFDDQNSDKSENIEPQRKLIEPWLAAVFQSEHLALLLGNGIIEAVASLAGTCVAGVACDYGGYPLDDKHAMPAHRMGRLWKFKKDEVDGWVKAGGAAEQSKATSKTAAATKTIMDGGNRV